jgi:hypothetical protein
MSRTNLNFRYSPAVPGTISQDDLYVGTDGDKSVVRKLIELANSGIRILSSTDKDGNPVAVGTGYVTLGIDDNYIIDLINSNVQPADWNTLLNKPSTFTPSAHTHPISDVAGLQAVLDGKESILSFSNGLTRTGNAVELGGALTSDIVFTGNLMKFDFNNLRQVILETLSADSVNSPGYAYIGAYGSYSSDGGLAYIKGGKDNNQSSTISASGFSAELTHFRDEGDWYQSKVTVRRGMVGISISGPVYNTPSLNVWNDGNYYGFYFNNLEIASPKNYILMLDADNKLWKTDAASFTAANHTHAISDITGLQAALDGKAPSSGSGYYIQNQYTAAQAISNFWIDGNGKINGRLQVGQFTNTGYAIQTTTLSLTGSFAPTIGSDTFTSQYIAPTIDQTGTANGIIYGLYYNPTLTSVRGTHWGAYIAAGQNFFAGRTQIGTTIWDASEMLRVNGSAVFGSTSNSTNSRKFVKIFSDYSTNSEAILVGTPTVVGSSFTGINVAPTHTNSGTITAFRATLPGVVYAGSTNRGFYVTGAIGGTGSTAKFRGFEVNMSNASTYDTTYTDNYGGVISVSTNLHNICGLSVGASITNTVSSGEVYGINLSTSNVGTGPQYGIHVSPSNNDLNAHQTSTYRGIVSKAMFGLNHLTGGTHMLLELNNTGYNSNTDHKNIYNLYSTAGRAGVMNYVAHHSNGTFSVGGVVGPYGFSSDVFSAGQLAMLVTATTAALTTGYFATNSGLGGHWATYIQNTVSKDFSGETSTIDTVKGAVKIQSTGTFKARSGGAKAHNYALWIDASGAVDYNWAIYSNSGKHYFSDNLLIGTTTDNGNKLQVNGGISSSSFAGTGTRMVVADANGKLSTQEIPSGGSGGTSYTLPIASDTVLGGIKVGTGLSMDPATGLLSSSPSCNNGLTNVNGTIKLGGTLSLDTNITTMGFDFNLQSEDGTSYLKWNGTEGLSIARYVTDMDHSYLELDNNSYSVGIRGNYSASYATGAFVDLWRNNNLFATRFEAKDFYNGGFVEVGLYSDFDVINGGTRVTLAVTDWSEAGGSTLELRPESIQMSADKYLVQNLPDLAASKMLVWNPTTYQVSVMDVPAGSVKEDVVFLSGNYTVITTNKRQNLIWEVAANGTITLPTGTDADGLVIYFRNITVNQVTFSQNLYYSSTQFHDSTQVTFGRGSWKLIYDNSISKWFIIDLSTN